VLRLASACDMGRAINPMLVEGQIEGGCIQALGYSLTEDIKMKNGKILNNRFANYIIPTAADVPMDEAIIVEEPFWNGPFGAKGLGEMPCVFVGPCVADAVAMASGIDLCEIPITPEKLLAAKKRGEQKL
ncbi:MAG: molybdopterin-dependent oxidoreductase, partial [bacterium]|nr:molybdopterin-dependent oxidoreductase [bacterium]